MNKAAVRIGPEGWPDDNRTLFWALVPYWTRYLRLPDGPRAGEPWEFTAEQARFVAWWYAIDARGRFVYRRGTLRRMKGWGKDPLGSVLSATEFVFPCRFAGWRPDGFPLVAEHPAPWIQIAAVSREQTRNTMRLFPGLFSDEAVDRWGIDVNKEIVYARSGRAVIEAVTSSPLALEGGRATFVLKNEVQNWNASNSGHDMDGVIAGNLAKSRDGSARALSICNAHIPGMDSVGERDWDAFQKIEQGRSRASGVLYDALEAPPDTDMSDHDSLVAGLLAARGDSDWLDVERLVGEVWDPRTPPSESRRKYLNQIVASEDAWIRPHLWDALADPSLSLADGEMITLGFDGSKTDDHTALIATRVCDGAWFTLGVWDPEEYGEQVPRDLVDAAVRSAFEVYDVVAFFSDLHPWESYVDSWAEELGEKLCVKASASHKIAYDMRARTKEFNALGSMRVHDEISEGKFAHDGNARVRQHVHNARRRPDRWGNVGVGKEHRESSRKIDALPAGILSRMAYHAYLALPKARRRRQKTGRVAY